VKRGITVLTKSDAVDAEMLDVVRLEVEEFLRGTFLELPKAPIVAVSALAGAGLNELKEAIIAAAAEVKVRDSRALARLPVDRVFTMKGFGTVVTGTLISGTIGRDEELEIFPTGQRVRVRGVQVHGQTADNAVAGQRTALNLTGASTDDLARGMTLAPPATFAATRSVDVQLRLLSSAQRALKSRTRVHFHSHSMETVAEIVFHRSVQVNPSLATSGKAGTWQLAPGSEAFARIKFPEAALLLPGDRFIIRQFSPVVTIGGGVVLDAAPLPGFKQATVHALLQASAADDPVAILTTRIARRGYGGLTLAQAVTETGWRRDVIASRLAGPLAEKLVLRFGDLLLDSAAQSALSKLLPEAVSVFHKKNPLVPGMSKEALREKFGLSPEVFTAVTDSLMHEKKIEIAGDLVRLPGLGVVMKDEEAESKKKIEEVFAVAGLKVPALQDVISGLKVDKARAQKIVTLLLRDKVLVKISEELVFHRTALEQLRRQIAGQKTKSPKMDVAQFKELTGVSRKYAIPLLEYLDRERVTRRVGDVREIL